MPTKPGTQASDFTVKEDGKAVKIDDAALAAAPKGVVIVVDTSGSMGQDGKLDSVKAAVRDFVSQKRPQDQMAIVSFNNSAQVIQGLTADANKLSDSVSRLQSINETAMWDGVNMGLRILAQSPADLQANVVLITDGRDTVSSSDFATTRANVLSANASVFSIGIVGVRARPRALQDLATASGGTFQSGPIGEFAGLLGSADAILGNQYEVSYTSTAKDSINLEVSAGDLSAKAQSIGIGTVTEGFSARPDVVESKSTGVFNGAAAKWIVALLVLVAAGLLAYALILIVVRDESTLQNALQPYAAEGPSLDDDGPTDVRMAETAFVKRASRDDRPLRGGARRPAVGRAPARAGRPAAARRQRPSSSGCRRSSCSRSSACSRRARCSAPLVLLFIAAVTPAIVLSALSSRRRQRKFTSQLPDTLQLLSGSLRAGYSLMQGVEAVSQEVDEPDGPGAAPGGHRGPPRVARSRSRSTTSPSAWTAPTSRGRSWPSASSGRSAATWPSCC